MEKKYTTDSNKKKYRLIKKTIPFCKFKTNQKSFTNQSQLNDGLVSCAQRFYKNSKSLPAKIVENKMEPEQGVYSLFLKKSEEEGKAKMRLEELKKKFINLLMRDGEKSKAYKLFAHSLKQLEEKRVLKNNTLKVFDFFTAQKKQLLDLDQKQHKQKKEKKNKTTNKSDRVKQTYYNDFLRKNISGVALYNSVNMLYLHTLWPWSAVHIHLSLVGFLRLVMQGQCHYGNKQGQKSCTLRHNHSPSSPPPCVCQAQTSQSGCLKLWTT